MEWIPGHWRWDSRAWLWEPGHYIERPHRHAHWVPGHWTRGPGGSHWEEGYWR